MEERRLGLVNKKGALLSSVVRPHQTSLHTMASPRKFREGAEGVKQLSLEEYVHAKAFAQMHPPPTARDSTASEGSNSVFHRPHLTQRIDRMLSLKSIHPQNRKLILDYSLLKNKLTGLWVN